MKKRTLKDYLLLLYKRIEKHEALGYSSQLAYFFLLSLFPFLIAIFSLLPFLPLDEKHILAFFQDFAPGETLTFIEANIKYLMREHNEGLLSFGIIATIWSASNGMNAIIRAINRAYEIDENRPFFVIRGLSVIFTFVMILVIVRCCRLANKSVFFFSVRVTEQFMKVGKCFVDLVPSYFIVFTVLADYAKPENQMFFYCRGLCLLLSDGWQYLTVFVLCKQFWKLCICTAVWCYHRPDDLGFI